MAMTKREAIVVEYADLAAGAAGVQEKGKVPNATADWEMANSRCPLDYTHLSLLHNACLRLSFSLRVRVRVSLAVSLSASWFLFCLCGDLICREIRGCSLVLHRVRAKNGC